MKTARTDRKWSQGYVGTRLGVSGPTYGRWEVKGKVPQIEQLEEVAALLGIPRDVALQAAGAHLKPSAERRIHEPLAELIAAMPLPQQKSLLANLVAIGQAVSARS
jgi:transcriptional regulator with XRE-family HTH domain